ncbi:hypothetical protein Bca101_082216 [Brassica carinata]
MTFKYVASASFGPLLFCLVLHVVSTLVKKTIVARSTFHTLCVIGALHLKLKQCFKLFSHEFEVLENSLAALRHCCICGLECKGLEVIMSKVGGGDKYLCSCSCLMRNRQSSKEFVIHR